MFKRLEIFCVIILTMLLSSCAGGSLSSLAGGRAQPPAPVINREAVTAKTPIEPHKIALLLPMKGELASSSQAIKNGFLAAYYYYHNQKPNLNINVIDTSGGNIAQLYAQAVASGSDIIVGPLTKPEVEQVSNLGALTVPTIALNTLDDYQSHVVTNLYQFGLLPQDEAQQVASKMLSSGEKRVAIIAPQGSWGEKIVANFRDKYEGEGGKVVTMMSFGPKDNLTAEVCQLVAQDPNQMCIKRKYKNKDEPLPLEKVRRQDIDAIFLVATPQHGRQIIPLLKFYYAGDLPVFSISAIYSGNSQPGLDQDLNGVLFCDVPWVLPFSTLTPEQQAIRGQITSTWGDSVASSAKLYALGVDAFSLALNFHNILAAPQSGVSGATGTLYLDNYNHFYRQLDWAQMRQGVPVRY